MTELDLAAVVLRLLDDRAADASICPSEVAREVGGARWRPLMDDVREAVWDLESEGKVLVTQGVRRVGREARGPIRIRRPAPTNPLG